MRRRRTLSKEESQALLARRMLLKRENMSPADVERLMRKTIHELLDRDETMQRIDLVRANIPEQAIDMHFRRILLAVIRERRAARQFAGEEQ